MKARQGGQSWCSEPLVGRGLLLCLPSSSTPALPHPLSLCGRDKKTKPEGGPWPPSVKTGGCSQKWALLTSFLDKNHLALGELPRVSLFPTHTQCVQFLTHVHAYGHVLTDGTCTPAHLRALEHVPMGVHVCTWGPHECTHKGTLVATACSTWV